MPNSRTTRFTLSRSPASAFSVAIISNATARAVA